MLLQAESVSVSSSSISGGLIDLFVSIIAYPLNCYLTTLFFGAGLGLGGGDSFGLRGVDAGNLRTITPALGSSGDHRAKGECRPIAPHEPRNRDHCHSPVRIC